MGRFFGKQKFTDLEKLTATTLRMLAGAHVQGSGQGISTDSILNLDFGVTGLGGLDTGVIAANTIYYIYLVNNNGAKALVASTSPNGPLGFSVFAEVGKVITNVSSEIYDPVVYGRDFKSVIKASGGTGNSSVISDHIIDEVLYNGVISEPVAGVLTMRASGFVNTTHSSGNTTINSGPGISINGEVPTTSDTEAGAGQENSVGYNDLLSKDNTLSYLARGGVSGSRFSLIVTAKYIDVA